jgi:hypothetical protein
MIKKEFKFKIYKHECVECGHSTWRDFIIEDPMCVQCQSTNPPNITEDELVKEVVINNSYTPEDYAQAKRIAQEIIDGKPLEEIEGLGLDFSPDTMEPCTIPIFFRSRRQIVPGMMKDCMISGSALGFQAGSACVPETDAGSLKDHYY